MFKDTDRFAYWLMVLPGLLLLLAFTFVPLAYSAIAFQKFNPALGLQGSPWVGLDNLLYMFGLRDARQVLANTVFIAAMKIGLVLLTAVSFALLLNEVRFLRVRRAIQTMVYLPHFLSWVILAGILRTILARDGLVNDLLGYFGVAPVYFLGQPAVFPWVIVLSDVWKEFGFEAIVYVSLPAIAPVIVLVACLSIGNVLNAGFDQIFNLYSPIVYSSGDILDTYVYRIGLIQGQYSLGTAVGLFKTVVALGLIGISYWAASRYANYRIF